jgi:putative peptidoglycan lipid II flippase
MGDRRLIGGTSGGAHRRGARPVPVAGTPDASLDASEGALADALGAGAGAPVEVGADETATAATGTLQRAALWMAAGTGVSRLTGLLRVIALAYALGATHLADGYNLANTTPNMLYDIVLGGILSATFIPVFVDRLATRSEREAWRAISAVVTASLVVLVVMTVLFWVLAPQVIGAFTAFDHTTTAGATTQLAQEKSVATTLLRWFVPQVALYGVIALVTALLNARRRFAAPMWVPIANNLVCIGVLLWFHAVVPNAPSLAGAEAHQWQLVLLGLGTTAGVALQAALLLPGLRGLGGRLRWRWEPRHEAVRTVVRLGGWTFGFVIANQVALFVVLALAVGAPGADPVSSYTYAYTFFQMPYAVVAVSVMSAVTPDLSEKWATGDAAGFRHRLAGGLRATLAVIVPASVGMLILAKPAVALLLAHGSSSVAATATTGSALALFSLGLPGFCAYLYVVRVLQSMQRTKVAFWLYLVENAINVVFAVALVHPLGVRGLALSLSIAYSAAAIAGVVVLRRWLGPLGDARTWAPLRRVAIATVVMGVVVLVVSNLSGADHGVGLLVRIGGSVIAGALVYAGTAIVLGGRRRPMALLTGGPLDDHTDPDDRSGAGGLSGVAWGDSRVPVYTGPRVRIVPRAGTPEVPEVPVAAAGHRSRPAAEPGAPIARASRPSRAAPPAARARPPSPAPGRPPRRDAEPPRAPGAGPAGPPGPPAAPAAETGDNGDDPGNVRWLGGTATPRRPRPPR